MEVFDQVMLIAFNLGALAVLVRFPLATLSMLASGAMHLWWPTAWPWPLLVVPVGLLAETMRSAERTEREATGR